MVQSDLYLFPPLAPDTAASVCFALSSLSSIHPLRCSPPLLRPALKINHRLPPPPRPSEKLLARWAWNPKRQWQAGRGRDRSLLLLLPVNRLLSLGTTMGMTTTDPNGLAPARPVPLPLLSPPRCRLEQYRHRQHQLR
jgi:hypothetical protein